MERNRALCLADHRGDTGQRARSPGPSPGCQGGPRAGCGGSGGRCSLGRGAPGDETPFGGRGARHLQLGGRIKARVINAMLWPPSTINALS